MLLEKCLDFLLRILFKTIQAWQVLIPVWLIPYKISAMRIRVFVLSEIWYLEEVVKVKLCVMKAVDYLHWAMVELVDQCLIKLKFWSKNKFRL